METTDVFFVWYGLSPIQNLQISKMGKVVKGLHFGEVNKNGTIRRMMSVEVYGN